MKEVIARILLRIACVILVFTISPIIAAVILFIFFEQELSGKAFSLLHKDVIISREMGKLNRTAIDSLSDNTVELARILKRTLEESMKLETRIEEIENQLHIQNNQNKINENED